jgi:hypothetical protein
MRKKIVPHWGPDYERDCVRDLEAGVPNVPGGPWRQKQQQRRMDDHDHDRDPDRDAEAAE